MANIGVGYKTYIGLGKETTWGTGVAPTVFVEGTNYDLKKTIEPIKSGALIGSRFNRQLDVDGSVSVGGSFELEINPDNIGLILGSALGTEVTTQVSTTTAYDHAFTPGDTLVPLSVEIYKDTLSQTADYAQRYSGINVNSLNITAAINAYLTAKCDVLGKNMAEAAKASPSYSSKGRYYFKQGSVEIDSSAVAYVKNFDLTYPNNLYADRYVLNSSNLRTGLQPQAGDITGKIELESTNAAYAAEIAKYLANTDTALSFVFTSDEEIESGYYYTITIDIPHVKYTADDESIGGKDIIPLSFDWEAWDNGTDDVITITLRDAQTTSWTA